MLFPTTLFAVFFFSVFFLLWGTARWPLARKLLLFAASFFFYAWWSWKFALLLVAATVVNHVAMRLIDGAASESGRKRWMILAVTLNLLNLGFFKYTRFLFTSVLVPMIRPFFKWTGLLESLFNLVDDSMPFIETIVLPIGISFFTFQAISAVVDVYHRKARPARTWLDFANYLAFFPLLLSGPITRAAKLIPQMEAMPSPTARIDVSRAATLILIGLFKKMILANGLAEHLANPIFTNPDAFGGGDILLGLYAYTIQIYCDFSAYSDMAIGFALLLGFELPLNFDAPYFATSLQDFWRRWHISLSTWLRDYLYIPLGGSRCSEWKIKRNLILTMLLGGLWHGAGWTFILWGAIHGVYQALERGVRNLLGLTKQPGKLAPTLTTSVPAARFLNVVGCIWIFQVVTFAWLFFRAPDLATVGQILKGLGRFSAPTLLTAQMVLLLILGFAIQALDGERLRAFWRRLDRLPWPFVAIFAAFLLAAILALAPSGVMPFIYFQF